MVQKLDYTSYDEDSSYPGQVAYAIFEKGVSNNAMPLCVFSTVRREARSGINGAESIIDKICAEKLIHWRSMQYAEVLIHRGYDRPKGYYDFHLVQPGTGESHRRWDPTGCSTIKHWQDVECPYPVYQAFETLIGTFPALNELISKSNRAYRDYSEAELQEELDWAKGWLLRRERFAEESRTKFANIILSPDEARRRGYRFQPWGVRAQTVSSDPASSGVWVDLKGSHLLGQHAARLSYDPLARPQPFAIWKR